MEYYRRLSLIRTDGDWEAWVAFFLEAVSVSATDAEASIIAIATQVATDRRRLLDSGKAGSASLRLFEMLPVMPRFNVERVRTALATTFPTANAAVKVLEDLGIVSELIAEENRTYISGVISRCWLNRNFAGRGKADERGYVGFHFALRFPFLSLFPTASCTYQREKVVRFVVNEKTMKIIGLWIILLFNWGCIENAGEAHAGMYRA